MLVHDIRKNESRVIDFRETAPSGLREEMLQDLEQKVNMFSESKGVLTLVVLFRVRGKVQMVFFGLVQCGFTLHIIKSDFFLKIVLIRNSDWKKVIIKIIQA